MGSIESYFTSAGKRYRVRYRTPERRDTQKRGFRTKREAEDYLASVEVAKLRGEWVDASRSRITVGEWSRQWLEAQVQLKPTTLSGYRHASRSTSCRGGGGRGWSTSLTPMCRPG